MVLYKNDRRLKIENTINVSHRKRIISFSSKFYFRITGTRSRKKQTDNNVRQLERLYHQM